jgi:hypothetical protein
MAMCNLCYNCTFCSITTDMLNQIQGSCNKTFFFKPRLLFLSSEQAFALGLPERYLHCISES